MIKSSILVLSLLFATTTNAIRGEDIDYSRGGEEWEGTCEEGEHQSPIDIPLTKESRSFNVRAL
jgi:carbonic anhydrase